MTSGADEAAIVRVAAALDRNRDAVAARSADASPAARLRRNTRRLWLLNRAAPSHRV